MAGPIAVTLGSGQHSSKEKSQRQRAVGDTVFDLTWPVIETQNSVTMATSLTTNRRVTTMFDTRLALTTCSCCCKMLIVAVRLIKIKFIIKIMQILRVINSHFKEIHHNFLENIFVC